MTYESGVVGISARRLLLEKSYEAFDRTPPGDIAALRREGGDRLVPGTGSMQPRAILIGEAPGQREDEQGAPFVGKSGHFLKELLEDYAGILRADLWITNVVKYRPPQNRTPTPEEIDASMQLLAREVALVAGKEIVPIVGLGRVACSAMAGAPISVAAKHGSWAGLSAGWKMFISYHPSAGLRSVVIRRQMRDDFAALGNYLRKAARNGS